MLFSLLKSHYILIYIYNFISNFNKYFISILMFLISVMTLNLFSFFVQVEIVVFFIMTLIFFFFYKIFAIHLKYWFLKEKINLYFNFKLVYILQLSFLKKNKIFLENCKLNNNIYINIYSDTCNDEIIIKYNNFIKFFKICLYLLQLDKLSSIKNNDKNEFNNLGLMVIMYLGYDCIRVFYLMKLLNKNVFKQLIILNDKNKEFKFF